MPSASGPDQARARTSGWRTTARVTVTACDARGRVSAVAPVVDATARLVTGIGFGASRERVVAKYGVMTRFTKVLGTFVGAVRAIDRAGLRLTVTHRPCPTRPSTSATASTSPGSSSPTAWQWVSGARRPLELAVFASERHLLHAGVRVPIVA
jgi:hypothetical protein